MEFVLGVMALDFLFHKLILILLLYAFLTLGLYECSLFVMESFVYPAVKTIRHSSVFADLRTPSE